MAGRGSGRLCGRYRTGALRGDALQRPQVGCHRETEVGPRITQEPETGRRYVLGGKRGRGGDWREECQSDSPVHNYTQTCSGNPTGSLLTILMEGVTRGHPKEQPFPEEWGGLGRPCAMWSWNSTVENLGAGGAWWYRRTAWSSHMKSPSYQDPRLKDQS